MLKKMLTSASLLSYHSCMCINRTLSLVLLCKLPTSFVIGLATIKYTIKYTNLIEPESSMKSSCQFGGKLYDFST